MKRSLVDVNLVIALLVEHHQFHRAARKWFEHADAGDAGLCRIVHLGVLRLLSNRSVMREAVLSGEGASAVLAELREDERVEFLQEPGGVDALLPGFLGKTAAPARVTDAYLACFARSCSRTLVTFDQGFRQFPGVRVLLLKA